MNLKKLIKDLRRLGLKVYKYKNMLNVFIGEEPMVFIDLKTNEIYFNESLYESLNQEKRDEIVNTILKYFN
ncbi:MAG: hypothetical protein PUG84_01535 [Peptoniphilaceae bacterium]|nr:hypothetical protein [Peptoniphilaceae bacterium]